MDGRMTDAGRIMDAGLRSIKIAHLEPLAQLS